MVSASILLSYAAPTLGAITESICQRVHRESADFISRSVEYYLGPVMPYIRRDPDALARLFADTCHHSIQCSLRELSRLEHTQIPLPEWFIRSRLNSELDDLDRAYRRANRELLGRNIRELMDDELMHQAAQVLVRFRYPHIQQRLESEQNQ